MNKREPEKQSSPQPNAIGDQNVERLLTSAYQPESLDPEFVQRVHARASAAAKAGRREAIASPVHSIARWKTGLWLAVAGCGLAALLAVGYVFTNQDDYYPDGELIWIDGQPYAPVRTGNADGDHEPSRAVRPVADVEDRVHWRPVGNRLLDAQATIGRLPPEALAVGDSLATTRGERRRVELPDNSILYLNENASVTVDAERRIKVNAGEVFVEVSPAEDHGGNQFMVATPQRDITALGTKFAVKVNAAGTDVSVTQGKVQISDVERMLRAGQQIRGDKVSSLPRASSALLWTSDLMAETESPLVPASEYGGGALVAVDPNGQQVKLSLRTYTVDVHIEDGFARTTIDQTYFNHEQGRLEGTFYFPLPPDASISRLAMYVNGQLMEGGMAEREHARDVFETIKYRSLDPALLEWIDGSTFKMRVFPLEGRQEKRIVLSYTQRLDNHYGRTQYRFPAGHNMDSVGDWSVKLHIDQGQQVDWKCASHDLKAETLDGDLTLTARAENVKPDRDVVVSLFDNANDAEGASERSRFSMAEHEGSQYLMLRFRPELPTAEQRQRRDWVFLLESDGSRDPLLARVQVDIIKSLLENAEHDDTFSIITAGTRIHALAAEQRPATSENIASAIEFLEGMHLVGALDLEQAFRAASNFTQVADHPVLVHIGGGFPILGQRSNDKLLESLAENVPYVGVGVGKRWNRPFMSAAASRTGGYFTQINPDEAVNWRAFELGSALNTPRLMEIHVESDQAQAEFLAVKDWVAHGEEYCAVAQLKPGQAAIESVTLSGSIAGEPYRRTIPVAQVDDQADYLPRTWARLAIDDMLELDAEANRSQIVELSKSMYVMSPFTSLLVLENDEMYEQYNVDRGRKDHWALYPCPGQIEVVHEPLHGPLATTTPESGNQPVKPSIEEVLRTLLIRSIDLGNGTRVRVDWTTISTVQLPVLAYTSVTTTVSVPDGGTVLIGGIKRLANRSEMGVPVLTNLPNVNRLFRNEAIGREASQLMMTVTPRIIIQEEEEAVLFPIWIDGSVNLSLTDFDVDTNGLTDFDGLIELINGNVTASQWQEIGGTGAINSFPANLSLVISQAQQVHGQTIRGFDLFDPIAIPTDGYFEDVNLSMQADGRGKNGFIDSRGVQDWTLLTGRRARYRSLDLAGKMESHILVRLDSSGEFKYEQRPLQEVIDDVRTRHDVPIVLNREAIEARGTAVDVPVTLNVGDLPITLRSALMLILKELDLVFFVTDDVLQITTPEDMENQLAARNYDADELLLLFRKGHARSPERREAALNDSPRLERWAQIVDRRISQGAEQANWLYVQPESLSQRRSTRRLVDFAPGFTTSSADALAVIEAEAGLDQRPKVGEIDERARELIEAARSGGWQLMTLRDEKNQVVGEVTMDGQGSFRLDHRTDVGLREIVVSDGTTLRHLYPELGLGTTRQMSRFHRAELTQLVPWLLPNVDDLALGADLRLIGPRTIAIAPHGVGSDTPDGSLGSYLRQHLEFSEDGRLAQRRLVEMPTGKTIVRVSYSADGAVRWFDGDNEQQEEFHISIGPADAPDLTPDVDALVLLPMPVRTRDFVYKTATTVGANAAAETEQADALRLIASDDEQRATDPALWSEANALQLLAAAHLQNPSELRDIIGRRFFARGDRRIGFYTLLLSSGERWDVNQRVQLTDGTTTQMDPLSDHPESALACYIDSRLRRTRFDIEQARSWADDSASKFVLQLGEYQQLAAKWSVLVDPPLDAETRRRELDELFGFVSRCESPKFACTLLRRLQRRYGDSQPHARIAAALIELEKRGTISYAVRYELARSLAARGERKQAQALFIQLYREALDADVLPPIDPTFAAVIQGTENPFSSDDDDAQDSFQNLMRGACAKLIQRKQRPMAIALAWQCRQLEHASLADILIDQILTGVPADEQFGTTMAVLEYLVEAGKHDRADALLRQLLSDPRHAESSILWRLAARIASGGGRLALSISHLERAMDLEFRSLPDNYNVDQVRENYRQLFARYHELATIVAEPRDEGSLGLVTRAIEAADRWRSLDTDVTVACRNAATVLSELGENDLAWDYLTTPLASRPNEAAPWLDLAQTLGDDGKLDLADRAYQTAFDAEPTNAQILWDHAQLLERAGRGKQAREIYRRIADGQWQPRFEQLKRRSEQINPRDD